MVYIKVQADGKVQVGGLVANEQMLKDGWVEYDGEIPQVTETQELFYEDGLLTVKTNKQLAIQKAKEDYEKEVAGLVGNVPFSELTSWTKQEVEARALLADENTVTPMIDQLVVSRGQGETRVELAQKIVANADAYSKAYAKTLGEYQAKMKELEQLPDDSVQEMP